MKSFEERFIIDCYGIIDTDKELKGNCKDDVLSWKELCDTLNNLYESANLDNEKLIKENSYLKAEIRNLKNILHEINKISEVKR